MTPLPWEPAGTNGSHISLEGSDLPGAIPNKRRVADVAAVAPAVQITAQSVAPLVVVSLTEKLKSQAIGSAITTAIAFGVTFRADVAALIGVLDFGFKAVMSWVKR